MGPIGSDPIATSESVPAETTGLLDANAPTQHLVAATVGDRCATCSAPLASDQRYCVNCGARRGKARFSFADHAPQTAAASAAPPRAPRRPRWSSSSTLVAGIGTLLIAMGVGVLIGRTGNNSSSPRAATPSVQVVTVAGAGGPAASSTTPTAASKTKAPKLKKQSKAAASKTAAAASSAAGKALGTSNKNVGGTATIGQSGTGPGYTNHKFSGTFFH